MEMIENTILSIFKSTGTKNLYDYEPLSYRDGSYQEMENGKKPVFETVKHPKDGSKKDIFPTKPQPARKRTVYRRNISVNNPCGFSPMLHENQYVDYNNENQQSNLNLLSLISSNSNILDTLQNINQIQQILKPSMDDLIKLRFHNHINNPHENLSYLNNDTNVNDLNILTAIQLLAGNMNNNSNTSHCQGEAQMLFNEDEGKGLEEGGQTRNWFFNRKDKQEEHSNIDENDKCKSDKSADVDIEYDKNLKETHFECNALDVDGSKRNLTGNPSDEISQSPYQQIDQSSLILNLLKSVEVDSGFFLGLILQGASASVNNQILDKR